MAARFWVGGGSSNSWAATASTNWAATSGGANNQTVPGASDDATFDGAGASGNGNSTLAAAGITLLSLTFTSGYTATVTLTGNLTVNGNFTDNSAHAYSGGGTLTFGGTGSINGGGKTWPNAVSFAGTTPTFTFTGNFSITGAVNFGGSGAKVFNKTVSETLTVAGGFNVGQSISGTLSLILTGGTLQGNSSLGLATSFAGNITVSGSSLILGASTFTYTSGIITTTGSTVNLSGGITMNTNGITWANLLNSAGGTITINSALTMTGTFDLQTTVSFAGTSGFTCATLNCASTGAITITLAAGITYTITSSFSCPSSRTGSIVLFTSSSGSVQAILTHTGTACNVLASFTRIDASNGRAIWTFNGTITTCSNIFAITNLSFVTGKTKVIQANNSF